MAKNIVYFPHNAVFPYDFPPSKLKPAQNSPTIMQKQPKTCPNSTFASSVNQDHSGA